MKLTKTLLRTIIKEEISRMDEIFGFGKKGKTVTVTTGMNFPVMHRFLSGIQLAYDKSKDAFVGKDDGKTRVFKNLPGRDYQGRNFDGVIYAIAYKKMFKKEAPEPKKASSGSGQSQADASQKGGDREISDKIKRRVGGTVKVTDNVVAIKFSKEPVMNRTIYNSRGSKVVKVLKQLGFENAKTLNKMKDGFYLFAV
tara:strand:+ start:227 stop:817 length:591 start_codon:yes stop_codon:yes gene_type:complete